MLIRLAFTVALILSTVLPASGFEVVFKNNAEVDSESILLGDVADIADRSERATSLARQIIASAPQPGQVITLDARTVIARLVRQNSSLTTVSWLGSSGVNVQRKGILVSSADVQAAIDKFIEANLQRLPDADIRFVPDAPVVPFLLPTGKLSWDVVPSSPGIVGSNRFSVMAYVDGRVRKNFSVHGRTEAIAPVLVATKTLKFGDLLTPDSVMIMQRDLAGLDNYTNKTELVVGALAKRTIRSGAAIDTSAIEQPPIIKRGEMVKIVFQHKGLHLTARGIAKSDGRKDEMIRVRNSSSNKLIYCRVQAPGIVEVTL